MEERPLVSIVMPAYNAQAYIARAVRSVCAQTYDRWQLLVVDDGSTDGTADEARLAAAGDPRIEVLSLGANQGVAAARNAGLDRANGDYVWMPDSDDSYAPDLLACAVAGARKVDGGADAVIFGYEERYYDAAGAHLYDHALAPGAGVYPEPHDWHALMPALERGTFYGYPWNKLWRRSVLERSCVRFESVRLIEDILFAVDFFQDARSLVTLDATPYHYVKKQGVSLTNANEYGATEYWSLHERRVRALADQMDSWEALDDEARAVLGSLYVRFVVSTLERSHYGADIWSAARRDEWLDGLYRSDLYARLVPYAREDSSRALALAIRAAQARSSLRLRVIGAAAHLAHARSYGLFTRVRSGR